MERVHKVNTFVVGRPVEIVGAVEQDETDVRLQPDLLEEAAELNAGPLPDSAPAFDTVVPRDLGTRRHRPQLSQCTTADRIARARLADVEQRIRSLTALKAELELMIKGCRKGDIATCRVIEVLANHGQCAHDKH